MKKIRTVIVDDEKSARQGLESLLEADPEIALVKICKDGLEAIDFLNETSCDLLLLDIQMPAINGFDVLKSISQSMTIVFITAYDQYAIEAFEHHAIDYLLKPFSNERFYEALGKAKHHSLSQKFDKQQLNKLLEKVNMPDAEDKVIHTETLTDRLVIRSSGKIELIPKVDISWVEAFDYYIKVHTASHSYLIRDSLKSITGRLSAPQFIRVHKSSLVNTEQIKSIEHLQNAEYMLSLKDGTQVKVSRTYRPQLDKHLGL